MGSRITISSISRVSKNGEMINTSYSNVSGKNQILKQNKNK